LLKNGHIQTLTHENRGLGKLIFNKSEKADQDAKEVVDIINSLYRKEHETGKDWETDKILKYRQQYAPLILEKLKNNP